MDDGWGEAARGARGGPLGSGEPCGRAKCVPRPWRRQTPEDRVARAEGRSERPPTASAGGAATAGRHVASDWAPRHIPMGGRAQQPRRVTATRWGRTHPHAATCHQGHSRCTALWPSCAPSFESSCASLWWPGPVGRLGPRRPRAGPTTPRAVHWGREGDRPAGEQGAAGTA